jgi:hypothetical protein
VNRKGEKTAIFKEEKINYHRRDMRFLKRGNRNSEMSV